MQVVLWRLLKCLETVLIMFLSIRSVLRLCLDNVRVMRGQLHGSSLGVLGK